MKIAVLSSGLGHVNRGVEAWAEDLAAALYEKNIDVTLFKGGGKKEKDYEVVVKCLQKDRNITKNIVKFFEPFSGWRYGFGFPHHVQEITFGLNVLRYLKNYDIAHMQDSQLAVFLQWFKKMHLIKPKIILAHGTEEDNSLLKKIKYLQQLAPHHLSETKKAGISRKSWFWAPNFIDTDVYKPMDKRKVRKMFDIPQNAFVILQVAAIRKFHKRIDFAIDAIAKLKSKVKKPIMYIIAGAREEDTGELIKYGKKVLGDNVRFYVNMNRSKMPYLYSAADLFFLTSIKEMFGIVLLEAMSAGIPVVASDYPVQKFVVGPAGDCVDMTKQDKVVKILKKYINEPKYLQKKKKTSREWVKKKFSKDVVVDMYIKKYKEIIK